MNEEDGSGTGTDDGAGEVRGAKETGLIEADGALQSNPTDYMARVKRLYAMAGREMSQRREELRARYPELCDGEMWRMPKPNETERPGLHLEDEG